MFEQLDDIDSHVLAFRITGEISDEEHRIIDLLMRRYIAQSGRICILVVVQSYPSLSHAEALYEDLRMVKLHSDDIDKLAVVSNRLYDRTYVGLFGLFSKVETAFFSMEQLEKAKHWVSG